MLIQKKSIMSGKLHKRNINVTHEEIERWQAGELIQNAMPHLSADDREFLITGITPEEWDEAFGDDEWDDEELENDGL